MCRWSSVESDRQEGTILTQGRVRNPSTPRLPFYLKSRARVGDLYVEVRFPEPSRSRGFGAWGVAERGVADTFRGNEVSTLKKTSDNSHKLSY